MVFGGGLIEIHHQKHRRNLGFRDKGFMDLKAKARHHWFGRGYIYTMENFGGVVA